MVNNKYKYNQLEHLFIALVSLYVLVLSYNRDFGTDIKNYQRIFSQLISKEFDTSIEPLYKFTSVILQDLTGSSTAIIYVVLCLSIFNTLRFSLAFQNSIIVLLICLSHLLLQQFWGTIRMGLGISFLLLPTYYYLIHGNKSKSIFFPLIFHWSLAVYPLATFLKLNFRRSLLYSTLVYATVNIFGSAKNWFFEFIPSEVKSISNYAFLQEQNTSSFPHLSYAIHITILSCLNLLATKDQFRRFAGPLTILFSLNALFYDFNYIGGRVANIFISYKIIALVFIATTELTKKSVQILTQMIVLVYSSYVALSYYFQHAKFFQ